MADQQQGQQAKLKLKRRRRKKVCFFCVEKINVLDYKNTALVKRFVSDRGKILPRRNSGTCAKHQRMIANAVKRSRYLGILPYSVD